MNSRLTVSGLAARLHRGECSAEEMLQDVLARIADEAGQGSKVFTRVHATTALASAQASDTLRRAGMARSAIEGLPVSVKDLFDIAGETTLAGSVVLKERPAASADAEVVRRLRAAGAVIVGKTNMTEFAYSGLGINPHYGTPLNPWDRQLGRIPGGSSSGAAVSVADGMAIAGIGSDTGGSVRIPAALCGLAGFKPTARRVSTRGVLPLSTHLDSIGPIAPSVACCAALDSVLAGADPAQLAPADLRGLRLVVPTTVVLNDMDAHVAQSFAQALHKLAAAGAAITEMAVPAFARLASINAKGGFTAAEAWAWHREIIATAADRYDPRVVSRMLRGREMGAADFIDLLGARQAWIAEVEAATAGFDAMLMPTVPLVAPSVAELQASEEEYFRVNGLMLRNTTFINFLDGCALSIPCHDSGTAPVGLTIAAPAMHDARVLSIGLAAEALFLA